MMSTLKGVGELVQKLRDLVTWAMARVFADMIYERPLLMVNGIGRHFHLRAALSRLASGEKSGSPLHALTHQHLNIPWAIFPLQSSNNLLTPFYGQDCSTFLQQPQVWELKHAKVQDND